MHAAHHKTTDNAENNKTILRVGVLSGDTMLAARPLRRPADNRFGLRRAGERNSARTRRSASDVGSSDAPSGEELCCDDGAPQARACLMAGSTGPRRKRH